MFADPCESNVRTNEICISWFKPVGGNEIDNYIIEWMVEDELNPAVTIPYNEMESNTYTIRNLRPAQAVNVSIRANNSAGEGETSSELFGTGELLLDLLCYWLRFSTV